MTFLHSGCVRSISFLLPWKSIKNFILWSLQKNNSSRRDGLLSQHGETWHPFPDRYRYVRCFLDDYSRYTFLRILSRRTELQHTFRLALNKYRTLEKVFSPFDLASIHECTQMGRGIWTSAKSLRRKRNLKIHLLLFTFLNTTPLMSEWAEQWRKLQEQWRFKQSFQIVSGLFHQNMHSMFKLGFGIHHLVWLPVKYLLASVQI